MEKGFDFNNLSPEEKAKVMEAAKAELKKEEEGRKREVLNYNQLKHETVEVVFTKLEKVSCELEKVKMELLQEFYSLLDLKNELYGIKEEQLSHNWSNADASKTIITGFNSIDQWDESVSAGIAIVNDWLDKKVKDDGSRIMAGMVRDLLKPNKDGVLKASRVLDLSNKAEELGDEELLRGVRVIREAHRPGKTTTYIKAKFKDDKGISHWLGLSMSSV